MKIRSHLSIFLILSVLLGFSSVSAVEYEKEVTDCISAQKNTTSGGPKSITKYICPENAGVEYTAFQVVLDLEFQKIDKEVLQKIKLLSTPEYKAKNVSELHYLIFQWFTLSGGKDDFFYKYTNVCQTNEVLKKTMNIPGFSTLTTDGGIDRVITNNKACNELAYRKLAAYSDAAESIVERNRVENFKSDKKKFLDKVRDKYESLSMKFTFFLGQLARIADKWNVKTEKVQPGSG